MTNHSRPRPQHQRLPSSLVIENPRLYRCGPGLSMARRGFPMNASDFSPTEALSFVISQENDFSSM
jgi:hypothetical protein